jgi:hypothetical protein
MASQMVHFSVTTGVPTLQPVGPPNKQINVTGFSVTSDTTNICYLKIWWQGNSNTSPQLGSTAPNATFQIPASTGLTKVFVSPLSNGGPCFAAITKNATDSDATALTGGATATIFVE